MGNSIEVLKTTDLESGHMKAVMIKEQDILIANVGNVYYTVSNICPHRAGKLSDGKLDGTIVECPVHRSRFNIANGKVIRRLNGGFAGKLLGLFKVISNIKTYKTEVEGDSIKVEL